MEKFVFILISWALCGIKMVLDCKKDCVNWFGLVFMGLIPFIPMVAHAFHIL